MLQFSITISYKFGRNQKNKYEQDIFSFHKKNNYTFVLISLISHTCNICTIYIYCSLKYVILTSNKYTLYKK